MYCREFDYFEDIYEYCMIRTSTLGEKHPNRSCDIQKIKTKSGSPSKDQAEQGADQNEHLVEHGRVGPLDGPVDVILPDDRWHTSEIRHSTPSQRGKSSLIHQSPSVVTHTITLAFHSK